MNWLVFFSIEIPVCVGIFVGMWFFDDHLPRRRRNRYRVVAYEAAKPRAALLSRRAQMEADLFRPVSEWIAEAEAEAEREWAVSPATPATLT